MATGTLQKKICRGGCLLYSISAFCQRGRCRVGRDRAQTSRAAFGTKRTFLTANPLFFNATASGLDVHGGSGPPKCTKSTVSKPKCTSAPCHLTGPRQFRDKKGFWAKLVSCRLLVLAVPGAPKYVTPCMGRLRMSGPVCTTLVCRYWPRAQGRTTTGWMYARGPGSA